MKVFGKGLGIPLLAALAACGGDAPGPAGRDAGQAPAPELFTGTVPVELVRYFAGGGDFLDTLPPDFPPFSLPASFQILGSQVTDRGEQIILATALAPERAREVLAEAFRAEEGWEDMEAFAEPVADVFLPARPEAAPAAASVAALELCHERYGVVRIEADYLGEVLSLNRDRADERVAPDSRCEQEAARRYRASSVERRYAAWQPSLRLPEGEAGRVTGTMGSDELLREVRLHAEDSSPAELARHFAGQMEAQGWERVEEWSGELSAGNAWNLQPAGGPRLSGWLSVVRTFGAAYTIQFGLRADPA